MKCPTCGYKVRIEGETTKYYVPEERDEMLRMR